MGIQKSAIKAIYIALLFLLAIPILQGCSPSTNTSDMTRMKTEIATIYSKSNIADDSTRENITTDAIVLHWYSAILDHENNQTEKDHLHQSLYDLSTQINKDNQQKNWILYQEIIVEAKQKIIDQIAQSVSTKDLQLYYNQNIANYSEQDSIDLDVLPWVNGEADPSNRFQLHINSLNARQQQEYNQAIFDASTKLQEHETVVVTLGQNKQALVTCLSRKAGPVQQLKDIESTVRQHFAQSKFAEELKEKIKEAQH